MNTQLAGLVEAAYEYHPFGWNTTKTFGEYAIGPTFMAYCPDFQPLERRGVYIEKGMERLEPQVESMLTHAPEPDPELTVLKDAHKRMRTQNNCKARALALGEYEMDVELAYPLYKLMRFYKPNRFALENGTLYAWDGERIVFAGQTRPRIGNCMEAIDAEEE